MRIISLRTTSFSTAIACGDSVMISSAIGNTWGENYLGKMLYVIRAGPTIQRTRHNSRSAGLPLHVSPKDTLNTGITSTCGIGGAGGGKGGSHIVRFRPALT